MRILLQPAFLTMPWLVLLAVPPTRAQSADDGPGAAIDVSGRGGLPSTYAIPGRATKDSPFAPLDVSVRAGLASDYIYRGTTLSDHKPAVGTAVEASYSLFYAGTTVASVKLPTNPAAEMTFNGGIRPKVWDIEFDFGWTYLLYPGETEGATNGTDYWETSARASYQLTDEISIAAGFAYSPSVSNTGAWSKYAASGLSAELPKNLLPNNLRVSLSGAVGYFWFGNQSPALGGFPLPAYTNWNAGITFTRKMFNLDLRYSNTNLSREDCFVFTGDPGSVPGGRSNAITNPDGLVSNWCGPAAVAKLWFALN